MSEITNELTGAGERANRSRLPIERRGMQVAEPLPALGIDVKARFAQKHVGKQAAAHADLAMNAPDRDVDPLDVKRFAPCQHVLIDTVDQRAVEVEHERCLRNCCVHR
jgi:hypothetical protein